MFEQSEQFVKICSNILGQYYNSSRLAGGINNPTYLLSNKSRHFVLKKISTDPTPIFDRYLAEKQFLHLANIIGDINTPKLIEFYDAEIALEEQKITHNKLENLLTISCYKVLGLIGEINV